MGEAKRRRDRGEVSPRMHIKIAPRKREAGFVLVHHDRLERQDDQGLVYAHNVFRVVDADGKTLVEETPDGPKPVLLMSVAQPVRQTVLGRSGLVLR